VLVESRQGANLLYLPLDKIMQQVSQGAPVTQSVPADTSSSSVPPAASVAAPSGGRDRESRTRERDTR
jgi:membrane protease subunit HflK